MQELIYLAAWLIGRAHSMAASLTHIRTGRVRVHRATR